LGLGISSLGLFFRAWAAGHLRKEKELTVSGPYQYTRNPLYFGSFIIGIGVAAASESWWSSGLLFAYFFIFYPMVIRREKERMNRLFPQQYESYKKLVPLFVPALKKQSAPKNGGFRWDLYKTNKEYRALLGIACLWGILVLKILLFR
jgi:protein-S-isoprenylcysteine O-methyltransferase Ste14